MAYISTLLDSPAVVSLVDGKLLAGGGRGGTLQSFIQGGSTLWSNLLPIYKQLLIKTVAPFKHFPLKNGAPFTYLICSIKWIKMMQPKDMFKNISIKGLLNT